jgi:citrate synthase
MNSHDNSHQFAVAHMRSPTSSVYRLFGHRIYRVRDPRADALKTALKPLLQSQLVPSERAELAQTIEQIALDKLRRHKPGRPLETNVKFYTALLLDALGFARGTFTCIFAMGRVSGWIAHAREQILTGRLIRPQSRYTGPSSEIPLGGVATACN